jgi:hypothetical protein
MDNQQKAKFVSDNFGIQCFWGGHGKISPRTRLMTKGTACTEFLIQQPGRVPTIVTRTSLTVWSCITDQWKAERVNYQNLTTGPSVSENYLRIGPNPL